MFGVLIFSLMIYSDEFEDGSDVAEDDNSDGEDTFMSSYSDALNSELRNTFLKKSFIHANEEPSKKSEVFLSWMWRDYYKLYMIYKYF